MKYFISDMHFGHNYVIEFSNRPFASLEEMHEALINNWNDKVSEEDEVYVLGDMFMDVEASEANEIVKQLNGIKYLIKGNHEDYIDDPEFDTSAFEWIKDYHLIDDVHPNVVLFHYPILEWDGWHKGTYHLYGHTHNTKQEYFEKLLEDTAVNVGVDIHNFAPISLDEVTTIIKQKKLSRIF